MRTTLQAWDKSASDAIVTAARREPWRSLVRLVSLSGLGWLWLGAGIGLALTGRWPGRLLLLAVILSFVLTQLLKGAFRRPRPAQRRVTIATDRFAFPSGHAVRVGTIACSLSLSDPSHALYWLIWALLVALARVARARHYFLDVSIGLLLGVLLGPLILALAGR